MALFGDKEPMEAGRTAQDLDLRLGENGTGVLLDLADVGVSLEIVLVAKAFEEEERKDVGLVVLAGGLAAQDVCGAPEPGFEFRCNSIHQR